ncbi:tagatose 1,6-diphosphate aldolase [Pelagibius sp. Alg239-R121]|uniref:tagatose 1,6-diphosphate aldolase n=1 Tax=Pelagibius sp. Alg239-R121 TaxID=2993448 RepID=UPI0024A6E415|nr:tagatose 1,6-diphosphate aldolase [Pelagibius sp. Alg239-R121]
MEISAGKLWSLRRLADAQGRFKMVAVDQRPPIMNLIASEKGVETAPDKDVSAIKETLTRSLAPQASAMLLDPIWAYSDAVRHVHPGQGLIVTLEDHRFEETIGGRKSASITDWSVEKIKRMGADAVKVLAWYRPDADPEICAHQQAYVEEIGQACARHDICFLFELLVYPLSGEGDQTRDYREHKVKRPQNVIDSVRTFADPKYGVDIFKLESPIPASEVPDPNSAEAASCQKWFDELGEAAGRPWVMLSAGADQSSFKNVLSYAYRAGASGFLAGRAIWWQAMQRYPDMGAVESALAGDSTTYMQEINRLTDEQATAWQDHPSFASGYDIAGAGPQFPKFYGDGTAA